MAKVKAPLFSLGASGSIGEALVYFSWKGINVVRQHVVPSNPQTARQNTQRGYITAAVAAIHAALALAANPLDEADKTAYSALGNTRPTPRTWFNTICKLWIDCEILSDIPCIYSNGTISNTAPATISLEMYLNEETASQLAAGKFYFGPSPTALIHSKAATIGAGINAYLQNEDCSAFLTAGVKYYFQFRPDAGDPCEGADSGIYSFYAT